MLLFVIGDFFFRRQRRRSGYARDELPMAPLARVLAFCAFLGIGGLLGIVALCGAYVRFGLGLPLDGASAAVAIGAGIFSPVCVGVAMKMWFAMKR